MPPRDYEDRSVQYYPEELEREWSEFGEEWDDEDYEDKEEPEDYWGFSIV